ncbi:MAG: hypothetical protein D6694_15105 [Gammaproteobacteria bacterium]|nr:MAG: hypothetical protein D6694_15105 [Gammaproteobacteria bacterium]
MIRIWLVLFLLIPFLSSAQNIVRYRMLSTAGDTMRILCIADDVSSIAPGDSIIFGNKRDCYSSAIIAVYDLDTIQNTFTADVYSQPVSRFGYAMIFRGGA